MVREIVYQGSTIDLQITVSKDGVALNPSSTSDIVILFRYKDGQRGVLKKFKKTAAGDVLAFTVVNGPEGIILCTIPATATQNAFCTIVSVEMKVKMSDGWHNVGVLDVEFDIRKSTLNDD